MNFEHEPRSSSAMAEYRPSASMLPSTGITHSVSSPSLNVLTSAVFQTHAVTTPSQSLAASQQNLKCLVPAYRPAPDYETAIRVKYGDDIAKLLSNSTAVPTPAVGSFMPFPGLFFFTFFNIFQGFGSKFQLSDRIDRN